MDMNDEIKDALLQNKQFQNDIAKLMRVLDICIGNVEGLYAYILKKNMLGMMVIKAMKMSGCSNSHDLFLIQKLKIFIR